MFCATQALATANSVNEQFTASDDDRGVHISSMLPTRGQACSSVRREMYQGQLPDGLARWSFSCFDPQETFGFSISSPQKPPV